MPATPHTRRVRAHSRPHRLQERSTAIILHPSPPMSEMLVAYSVCWLLVRHLVGVTIGTDAGRAVHRQPICITRYSGGAMSDAIIRGFEVSPNLNLLQCPIGSACCCCDRCTSVGCGRLRSARPGRHGHDHRTSTRRPSISRGVVHRCVRQRRAATHESASCQVDSEPESDLSRAGRICRRDGIAATRNLNLNQPVTVPGRRCSVTVAPVPNAGGRPDSAIR